eukprot:1818191-Prymnesium_polylepis.2
MLALVSSTLAVSAFSFGPARSTLCHRRAALVASAADEARLLTECRKEERSLQLIQQLIGKLSEEPPPTKPKRELLGDWSLEYASDADAVVPVTSGDIGRFAVIEGVAHRLLKNNEMETIEVARQFGPFGNARRGLNGKWSFEKEKGADEIVLRWRYTYLIDPFGRERDPPAAQKEAGTHELALSYLSDELMLLTSGGSQLVFSRLPNLLAWLEEYRVATEEEIKDNAGTAGTVA